MVTILLISVKRSNLSMDLWSAKGIYLVGNKLGKIIMVDNSFKEEFIRMIVHVIVEIDIRIWIYEIIYILFGDKIYPQLLDYSNVPFWCISCHTDGNIFKNFNCVFRSICGESILVMTFLSLETSKCRDT